MSHKRKGSTKKKAPGAVLKGKKKPSGLRKAPNSTTKFDYYVDKKTFYVHKVDKGGKGSKK